MHTELVWQVYHVTWPPGEQGGALLLFLVRAGLMFDTVYITSVRAKRFIQTRFLQETEV